MAVQKEDKITFSAYTKYFNNGSFGVATGLTIPAVGANRNFGIEGSGFLNDGTGIIFTPMNLFNPNSNVPHAYAVIHLLDKNGNVLESHEKFIQSGVNICYFYK